MHQPAVGHKGHVRHVSECSSGVFDEVVEGLEFFDQADGGGEDAQSFKCFGRFGDVVIAAVTDADFFPVVGEVEDGIDLARDGGPHYIYLPREEGAAEVLDIYADVGLKFGFGIHGDRIKTTDRGSGGDMARTAEQFEKNGLFAMGSLCKNVHARGRVLFADPSGFFERWGVELGEFVGGSFSLTICAVIAIHSSNCMASSVEPGRNLVAPHILQIDWSVSLGAMGFHLC